MERLWNNFILHAQLPISGNSRIRKTVVDIFVFEPFKMALEADSEWMDTTRDSQMPVTILAILDVLFRFNTKMCFGVGPNFFFLNILQCIITELALNFVKE